MRTAWALFIVASSVLAQVDPRIAGTWELRLPNADAWVLKIEAAGKYVFTIESAIAQPGHSGVFEAASGRWSLRSTAGTPWTDGGTYTFADQDTLSMTGNLGVAVWKRRRLAAAKPDPAPAAPAGGIVSKLAPLVLDARKEARGRNPDAALVG